MNLTIHVRNLQALRLVRWTPDGVCCLVGPNGSGKTTLVLALKLLRAAWERGLPQGVAAVLGGSWGLRNRNATPDEPIEIGIDVDGLSWRIELVPAGGSVSADARESLLDGQRVVFECDGLGRIQHAGRTLERDNGRTGLRTLHDMRVQDPAIETIAAALASIAIYRPPALDSLRAAGSNAADDQELRTNGANAFAVLHAWHGQREFRDRYRFVHEWLSAAFPDEVGDIDFQVVGRTVTLRTFRPSDDEPMLIARQSDGCIAMLVHLCALASLRPGGIVAIEEAENSLHPWAIRRLVEAARAVAAERDGIVVMTTHSPVLINQFAAEPEQVWIMSRTADPEARPRRLSDQHEREWLARFVLGELFEHGDIGGRENGE